MNKHLHLFSILLFSLIAANSLSGLAQSKKEKQLIDINPINRIENSVDPKVITGDDPARNHNIIWKKHETLIPSLPGGVLPPPSENVDYVFIGGGMANLIVAQQILAASGSTPPKMIFLEAGERFGGNSQGEVWNGLSIASGAAYISVPVKGSTHEKLLQDLGILSELQPQDNSQDPVFLFRQDASGKKSIVRYQEFWEKGTTPESKTQFNRLRDLFNDMINQKNGRVYPEIPPPDLEHRKYVESLDAISFHDYLKNFLGESLHPDVEIILDYYCRSSLGGNIKSISAAAGLNFTVGDFYGIATFPSGNGRIADALFDKIAKAVPLQNLRTESTVFDIQVSKDSSTAQTSYMGPDGKVRTIAAKNIISSTAPFILSRLIDDVEPERMKALHKMKYRPYLVANVLLKRNENEKSDLGYDLIFGDPKGEAPAGGDINVTDVVVGASSKNEKNRILTLYIPGDENSVRSWIGKNVDQFKVGISAELEAKILPALGYTKESVQAIRVALHGHAIPLASPGNIVTPKDGIALVDQIQKPYRDKVFFVGQAMWGLPAWETVVDSSMAVANEILGKRKMALKANNQCTQVFKK